MILACVGLFIARALLFKRSQLSLPPGPTGLPLIGNILDMPSTREWLTFARWGEKYGDICSVTVLGQPLVIINSARIATDMLDKKSAIYSDRPTLQMAGELVGWKNSLVLLPYGDRFRRYRRLFHRLIGSATAMKQFHPVEETETLRFLRTVLNNPDDLSAHIRRAVGATVLRITYGYEAQEFKDPFVQLADQATEQFSLATAPGGFLVDLIPALRHIPPWFPGASFHNKARSWASTLCDMVGRPFDFVKQQMAAGTAPTSFTSSLLGSKMLNQQEELDIRWSAASLYSGASDTTVSAIYSFFLAMTLYPDVAKRARVELDEVVGTDRLPSFEDRESLPYMNALIKEVFRWYTVVPTAVPHCSTKDDVHEGFYIPKGSLIIPNIWKFMHDPRTYRKPDEFRPERFLVSDNGGATEQDPRDLCFGFGRRVCPGIHFADALVFIVCAMSLATLDIEKTLVDGRPVEPVLEYSTGTISRPKPFRSSIKPRNARVMALVEEALRI
ncbi:O-methylsterigmatocystin oxidoreductase [Leucoagaricus sp. SymC.cos]|nr:O-methylsterigmatocystin oxidoreductase [Leucoagaricus sp. SymC.cos]